MQKHFPHELPSRPAERGERRYVKIGRPLRCLSLVSRTCAALEHAKLGEISERRRDAIWMRRLHRLGQQRREPAQLRAGVVVGGGVGLRARARARARLRATVASRAGLKLHAKSTRRVKLHRSVVGRKSRSCSSELCRPWRPISAGSCEDKLSYSASGYSRYTVPCREEEGG